MSTWEQERSQHYRRIENDLSYRNAIIIDWLEAESAPPITPYETPVMERTIVRTVTHYNRVMAELRRIETKLNAHLDYKKKTDAF